MSARPRTQAASATIARHPIAFAGLLLIAFALRAVNLTGESLWRDEVDIVNFALQPMRSLLAGFTEKGFNGPLYLLLMRPWLALAGVNDFALRYFSLLCSIVLIALVWALARQWVGPRAAWVTAWLLVVSPVHIWYAGEGKMYTLQPLLLVLAMYALARILTSNSKAARWWWVFVVATSCAFYVHVLSPVFLVVAAAVFVSQWPVARAHLKGAFIALACLTVPYVPLLIWQFPALSRGIETGHTFYPLGTMAQVLLADWSYGFGINAPLYFITQPAWVRWVCIGLFAGLAGLGLIRLLAQRPQIAMGLWAWLTLPALAVYAVSTRAPVFEPRYLLWCAPALFILIGVGITGNEKTKLSPPTHLALILIAPLTLISLLGLAAQWARPIRPDMRAATSFVASRLETNDIVTFQIPHGRYTFGYYLASRPLQPGQNAPQVVEGPYTNYGMSEVDVEQAVMPYVPPDRNLWLIELEPAMWDARGMVRQWYDDHIPLIERREFNGITVSLYRHHAP